MNVNSRNNFLNPWVYIPLLIFIPMTVVFGTSNLNKFLFTNINRYSTGITGIVWAHITILGDTFVAVVLLFPLIRKRFDIIWSLTIATIIATPFVRLLKPLLNMPRPPAVLNTNLINVVGPVLMHRSFPSGHTVTIFTLIGVIIFSVKKTWLRLLLMSVAILVGTSRIAIGVHWPLDVAAGATFGWFSAWAGVTLARKWTWGNSLLFQKIWGIVFIASNIVLLLFYNTGYSNTTWMSKSIAVLCLLWGSWEYAHLYTKQK